MDCVELPSRKRKLSPSDEEFRPNVGYVFDSELFREFNKIPVLCKRGEMVNSLIEAFGVHKHLILLKPLPATEGDLMNFHSSDFIEYLKKINTLYTPDDTLDLEYGLGYDCPPLDGIYDYVAAIAGSSLSAAKSLINGDVDIAINWCGGWHHARRDEVSGFCYVNDIVLAILEMRSHFNTILYIDLDVHHGDAVENAFQYSENIITLSFHKYEPGFFPGSGDSVDNMPKEERFPASINVPMKGGITDQSYCQVFDSVIDIILSNCNPSALVIQCGADGLFGDPLGGFSLTHVSYLHCVERLLKLSRPTLILGGGGYNLANTARLWTILTALIVGLKLVEDIPEHEFFTEYGPGYELYISAGCRKDENTPEYLSKIVKSIKNLLEE